MFVQLCNAKESIQDENCSERPSFEVSVELCEMQLNDPEMANPIESNTTNRLSTKIYRSFQKCFLEELVTT